ncbi:hypothetical protein F0726_01866 [Acidithiobacillus caldus]|nr:hypothetical protein F0726_01866 [Acidithiobacillus caldus]
MPHAKYNSYLKSVSNVRYSLFPPMAQHLG